VICSVEETLWRIRYASPLRARAARRTTIAALSGLVG
jgi:hypothetical protein